MQHDKMMSLVQFNSFILFSAVKYQMKLYGKELKEGDVIMTNSPHAGGS
jgi:N-methylhydantoinase B/oxoprolinase/acetone carboxylase alpha subunit